MMVPQSQFIRNNIPPPKIVEQIKIFYFYLDKITNPNSLIKTDEDIAKKVFDTSYDKDIRNSLLKDNKNRTSTYRNRYKKSPWFAGLKPILDKLS